MLLRPIGSPLIGFGDLPPHPMSLIDIHGINDDTIPHDLDHAEGKNLKARVKNVSKKRVSQECQYVKMLMSSILIGQVCQNAKYVAVKCVNVSSISICKISLYVK